MQPFDEGAFKNGASFMLVSNDLDLAVQSIGSTLTNFYIFPKPYKEQQDLLVDDVEDIFAESYLTSESLKTIVLKSVKYNEVVQNRLLKILEEPPHNIRFIILAKTQSAILPTIRSRISIFFLSAPKQKPTISFDTSDISLKAIFEFLKQCDKLDRDDAKLILNNLLNDCIKISSSKNLITDTEIAKFERAAELLFLNASPKIVIADILLSLLRQKSSR